MANLGPLMVAIGTESEIDTPGYGACPRAHRVDCKSGTCRCLEHQHSDHKLLVWGAVGKLKPARKKRPDQFRWKLGDLLDNRERRAAYEACCAAKFEALASKAASMTATTMEVAFRGLLTKVAQEQLGAQVRVPGEGRVKAHTWRVTKLYKAKRQASLHLKRAKTYGTPACVAECTQNYKKASAH